MMKRTPFWKIGKTLKGWIANSGRVGRRIFCLILAGGFSAESWAQVTNPPIESKVTVMVNGTADAGDDFVAVSAGTDSALATDLSVTLDADVEMGYTADISMGNADGDIKFTPTTVTLTPGVASNVKMWGKTPSSGLNKSTVLVSLKKAGKTTSIRKTVTVIDGIEFKFSGTFFSDIDARNECWRPGMRDDPATGLPTTNNATPDVIAADTVGTWGSSISMTNGDQPGLNRRAWSPAPRVTISEIKARNPDIVIPADPLLNAEVHMINGRFEHNRSQSELIIDPRFYFKTAGGSVFSVLVADRGNDRPIAGDGAVAPTDDPTAADAITAAEGVGNKLAQWLCGTLNPHGDQRALATLLSQMRFKWSSDKFNATKEAMFGDSPVSKAVLAAQELYGNDSTTIQCKFSGWNMWTLCGKVTDGILTTRKKP